MRVDVAGRSRSVGCFRLFFRLGDGDFEINHRTFAGNRIVNRSVGEILRTGRCPLCDIRSCELGFYGREVSSILYLCGDCSGCGINDRFAFLIGEGHIGHYRLIVFGVGRSATASAFTGIGDGIFDVGL